MSWRPAKSLSRLKRDVDRRWPNRDRRTDGFIGDAAHCGGGGTSDHCVNSAGVVRAFDIDADGISAGWLAEHLRRLGARGDPRLANGGYVIFNRRIASWSHEWRWRHYTGDNPHTDHIHLSVSKDASGYDKGGGWGVRSTPIPETHLVSSSTALPRHAVGSRELKLKRPHMRGTDVAFVQRWVGAPDDGEFGEKTQARVKRYQGIVGLPRTGVVGRETYKKMRVI
jgi:peptidoglycan hydrolase-like protein with peptidoglycan-binding domain